MGRPFIPYRRDLKPRSQALRRDPSPAERKLWYEFLRDLPVKFTRQKPLGSYIADFYCSVRVVRFTNTDVLQNFEGVCAEILRIVSPKR